MARLFDFLMLEKLEDFGIKRPTDFFSITSGIDPNYKVIIKVGSIWV